MTAANLWPRLVSYLEWGLQYSAYVTMDDTPSSYSPPSPISRTYPELPITMAQQTMPPFVTVCISCEKAVYLTKAPLATRTKLGLHANNQDTFLPTTCWQCEQNSNLAYNRLTRTAATVNHDWPGLVSTKMLKTWWLYHALKEKYGINLVDDNGPKLVVRIRDFTRHVLHGDVTAELLEFRPGKVIMENNDWRIDSFFGQIPDR